jgi:hypothetical protein
MIDSFSRRHGWVLLEGFMKMSGTCTLRHRKFLDFIYTVGILLNIARASHGGCIPSSKAVTVTD